METPTKKMNYPCWFNAKLAEFLQYRRRKPQLMKLSEKSHAINFFQQIYF